MVSAYRGFRTGGPPSLACLIHQITISTTQSMPVRRDLPSRRYDIAAAGSTGLDARGRSRQSGATAYRYIRQLRTLRAGCDGARHLRVL